MGTCKTTVMLMGRLSSVCVYTRVCVPVCMCAYSECVFGCPCEHTAETSKMLSEWSPSAAVVSSVWWPCDLFVQPQWPFLWLRGRKRNQERRRADRFTPSPLLAPPMSHLILLPTAKSTPLTHSEVVRTTTADCLLLYQTVTLGGISVIMCKCAQFLNTY